MKASSPLPPDDPRIKAWKEYQDSEEYENTKRWAQHEEHVDGSLWAAFLQGWTDAQQHGPDSSTRSEGESAPGSDTGESDSGSDAREELPPGQTAADRPTPTESEGPLMCCKCRTRGSVVVEDGVCRCTAHDCGAEWVASPQESEGEDDFPHGVDAWLDGIRYQLNRGEFLSKHDQKVLHRVAVAARRLRGRGGEPGQ